MQEEEKGEEGGGRYARCRLTLDSGVGLPYLYSALILSYHFALRQVNRPPAYRKPSERSWDSLSRLSGPTYELRHSHRLGKRVPRIYRSRRLDPSTKFRARGPRAFSSSIDLLVPFSFTG